MDRYQFDPVIQAEMEASPIPFAVYQFLDRRVVTLLLSAGFCELLGYSDRQQACFDMDHDMYRCAHPDDVARIADAAFRFATEGGEYNVVYRSTQNNDGPYIIIRAQGRHVYTDSGVRLAYVWYTHEGIYDEHADPGVDGVNAAFSKLLYEGSMVRHSHYDHLTGLPNMTYFFELAGDGIRRLRAEGKHPAVLYADLCGMKAYNSKWGFAEGDLVLRKMATILTDYFSNENCSRFGQDHFAVFTDAAGLESRLARFFETWDTRGAGEHLPVRVGICLIGAADLEIGKACDRAKMACDARRKTMASAFYYFSDEMLAAVEKRQYIIDNFDLALSNGWIQVYNQPIIRAANGRVCDEELLSRWIDPVKGFLSPADFIPALEESHLIYKLDLFVVEQALKKMKLMQDAGLYVVPQSVNLSRMDFDSLDIVEEIRRRVDNAGIDRSKLTIEITESVVGSDFEFIKTQVARFQSLGFRVWMDDFGSGYSSLDVLQNIHFDTIKFDMRFMQQLDHGEEGKIILTALTRMALGLGVETVCEGVEKQEQVEFLREIGCTKLQGFYFCKPIPPEEIIERNRKGIQIGFENPDESDYYSTIGKINLYDMGTIITEEDERFRRASDAIPMAIMEINGSLAKYIRCNQTYRDFMKNSFGIDKLSREMDFTNRPGNTGSVFMDAIFRCGNEAARMVLDEKVGNTSIHSFIRRVAVNPVTGTAAIAVAVLAVVADSSKNGESYVNIARALSSDYIYLYYIDLNTEEFIEYSSDPSREDLSVERHGDDFFARSRADAASALHPDDAESFIRTFTRENILKAIDANGAFIMRYRLIIDGVPTPVAMKIVRMVEDPVHLITGVSRIASGASS